MIQVPEGRPSSHAHSLALKVSFLRPRLICPQPLQALRPEIGVSTTGSEMLGKAIVAHRREEHNDR